MVANSIQQYNKWKAWERGEVKNTRYVYFSSNILE